jgi:hypothetical protein
LKKLEQKFQRPDRRFCQPRWLGAVFCQLRSLTRNPQWPLPPTAWGSDDPSLWEPASALANCAEALPEASETPSPEQTAKKPKARSFKSKADINRTFEDLISQKILLERFASASWFIAAAMQ